MTARVLLAVSVLVLSFGCGAVAEVATAKRCADHADRVNSEEELRETAEEKLPPELVESFVANFLEPANLAEAKAWDWASCMADRGYRCPPRDENPPLVCSGENTQASNPFLDE